MDQESLRKFNEEIAREALSRVPDFMNAILLFIQPTGGIFNPLYPTSRERCGNNNCNPTYETESTTSLLSGVINQLKGIDMIKLRDGDLDTMRISLELLTKYRNILNEKRTEDCLHYNKEDRKKITPFIETSIECLLLEYKDIPHYLVQRLIQSIIPYIIPIIFQNIFPGTQQNTNSIGSLLSTIFSQPRVTPQEQIDLENHIPELYRYLFKEEVGNMPRELILKRIMTTITKENTVGPNSSLPLDYPSPINDPKDKTES